MRQLASYPRQNGVAAALRELERTLFTLDWIDDPELRRTTGQELNEGEAATAWRVPCSFIASARSGTEPMRTSSTAHPV
jgi:TnpA family transposase